ncbi:DUF6695 family protein [Aquimarina sp. 2201CG5-10]|uniref:DUF6695 family protein n=1 Tax=Aquimarina callyspongiae TaxID=3098150 RepID=UPI002AB3B2AF|nr:DUF6695 family protein [Aquimarina sp. 2201CG5-10]MDY8138805.1 DUF6695 family protein [Aquimarina sp. 2201CG5-10]
MNTIRNTQSDYTGKIISLAFPDTFVRFSDESVLNLLPLFGLGKNRFIKAGHAAFVLIENSTGNAEYYDFGRYITPEGHGRVRSAVTDVELEIPFKALMSNDGALDNIEEFLLWLEDNPQKTHGSGRLVASVCDQVFYDEARAFVVAMQEKGSIPYKAFGKEGSNCSRIVTDTILAGTDQKKIIKPLLRNKLFTPSTVGNVEKAATNNPIYEVKKGIVKVYEGSAFKENMTNYFDKNVPTIQSDTDKGIPEYLKNAHYLSGTGSSAYFMLEQSQEESLFEISRYTEIGEEDFRGLFEIGSQEFDSSKDYQFIYDSNCKYCHIEQDGRKIRFDLVKRIIN